MQFSMGLKRVHIRSTVTVLSVAMRAFAHRTRLHWLSTVIQQSYNVALMNTQHVLQRFIITKLLNHLSDTLAGWVCACLWFWKAYINIIHIETRSGNIFLLLNSVFKCNLEKRVREQVYYYGFVTTATIVIDGWIFFIHVHHSRHYFS